ncbi:MAG: tetratricopeptide repeat protein, partial [Emcibacteraceae bacterium]|nr:tetratricopeptide repeat protein [Emcibacteraceae bacterium]
AKEAYEFLLNADADFPDGHVSFANLLHKTGEYDAAINHYEIAIDMAPGAPIVYNNLANVYRDIGELDKAEEGYQKSSSLAPHALELVFNLADIKKLKGDYEASRALYQNIDDKLPGRPVPVINLAILNFLLDDFDAAKKYADILTDEYISNVDGDDKRETCVNYKSSINELLKNKTNSSKNSEGDLESINVIGDHLALGFHGKVITLDGQDFRGDAKWVMGINASDLSDAENNRIKASVKCYLSNMEEGTRVHFNFDSDAKTNKTLKKLCETEKVNIVETL